MRLLFGVLIAVACGSSDSTTAAPEPARPAKKAEQVKVTVLSTMLSGEPEKGIGEWGFAALVEVDGKRLLVDTGARPDTVLKNAEELKIDLSTVTDVVLTHGHDDHIGGLLALRRALKSKRADALGRAHIGTGFFATRVIDGKDDSNADLKKAYEGMGGQFIEHDKFAELMPNVWFTGPVPRKNDEKNWSTLGKIKRGSQLVEDTVPEDSSIAIDTPDGLIVVAGCGHAGIVNIAEYVKATRNAPVTAVIGGLHLFNQTDDRVAWTGKKLKELGVKILLGAHCTGIEAVGILRTALGATRANVAVAMVGATFVRGKGIEPGPLGR